MKKRLLILVVFMMILLAGCTGLGQPLDSNNMEEIDQQIREAIEKTFPLPEQAAIRTHIGDDLTFSTDLSMDEIVAFYRNAYTQKGYVEGANSQLSADSASMLFQKEGEKDVQLEITKREQGSDVHIQLKPAAP